jgi:hypothetical protein
MLDLLIAGCVLGVIIALALTLPEAVRDTADRIGEARRAEADRLSRIRPVPFGMAEPTGKPHDMPAPRGSGDPR